jgi:hypothetical protein
VLRRDHRTRLLVVAGGLAAVTTGCLLAPSGSTYAAWSDYRTVPATAGAGVWLGPDDPPLPSQCAGIVFDRIIIGTNKSNVLTGTSGNDLLFGGNGQDTIYGLGGDDCVVGQNGKDWLLVGGSGNDVLVGANGKDRLYGGPGNDKLYGDNAPDYLYGGDGTDVLVGGNGPGTEFQDGPNDPPTPP